MKTIIYMIPVIALLAITVSHSLPSAGVTQALVLAHRSSSGLWPQNSRNAVIQTLTSAKEGKLKGRLHGIELDIALTKDGVPVLSHAPWIHKSQCIRADGSAVEHVLIRDIDFKELESSYLCGGSADSEFPDAETKYETMMGFDELLTYLKSSPELIVYLDVKIESGITASAEAFAKAIFERWEKAGMKNKLYVEGATAEVLAAFQRHAKTPYIAVLSYPPLSHRDTWTSVALSGIKMIANPSDPLQQAEHAAADAVASPVEIMTTMAQEYLQEQGMQVIVFTPNDASAFDKACHSGADIIITDYPNLGPCPKL